MAKAGVLALVIALTLASSLAGCFGKNEDTPPPTNTTGDTGGTGTGGTTNPGGTTGGTGGTGGNTTTPPAPAPRPVNETYSLSLQPGQAAAAEHPFTVPATGYTTFRVTATAQAAPPPAAGTPSVPFLADAIVVSVVDAAGTVVGSTEIPAGPSSGEVGIDVPAGGAAGAYVVRVQGKTAQVAAQVSGLISVTY